jgi:hypothetical protein
MNTGSPTDEKCQLMFHPLEPFIRWEIMFKRIVHVRLHATKNENETAESSFLFSAFSASSAVIFRGVI